MIAHRLSTVKNADEILCMQGGELVERGTHATLMAREGAYANLVRQQLCPAASDESGGGLDAAAHAGKAAPTPEAGAPEATD